MKIVFFCIPAHGHTNPTLGVVRELVRRGAQVWYYSFAPFRAAIEEAGATFVSCDEETQAIALDPGKSTQVGKDLALSMELLVNTTLALDERVCRDMARIRPQVIVADSMAVWGKLAAKKLGIPWVSSTTTFAFNRESAKIMGQGLGSLLPMLLAMPKVNKSLKRLRAKGYPVKNVLSILQNDNDTNTIVYTSRDFQPAAETFSHKYVFVGPSLRPVKTPLAPSDQKTVYISLGTVNNQILPFYQACLAALGKKPYRVVMAIGTGTDPQGLGPIPDHFQVEQQVDQLGVLSAADVFLTHCGMNSASEGLWFGVPLVCYPQTQEQQGVANRVLAWEAGVRLTEGTPQAIAQGIETVLSDPKYRTNAQTIAQSFRTSGGPTRAAEAILTVAETGK